MSRCMWVLGAAMVCLAGCGKDDTEEKSADAACEPRGVGGIDAWHDSGPKVVALLADHLPTSVAWSRPLDAGIEEIDVVAISDEASFEVLRSPCERSDRLRWDVSLEISLVGGTRLPLTMTTVLGEGGFSWEGEGVPKLSDHDRETEESNFRRSVSMNPTDIQWTFKIKATEAEWPGSVHVDATGTGTENYTATSAIWTGDLLLD